MAEDAKRERLRTLLGGLVRECEVRSPTAASRRCSARHAARRNAQRTVSPPLTTGVVTAARHRAPLDAPFALALSHRNTRVARRRQGTRGGCQNNCRVEAHDRKVSGERARI